MSKARARLSPLERRFVDEYLIDQNPRQAAVRAGYPKTHAAKFGRALLLNPVSRQAIQDAMKARSERTLVDADSVVLDIQSVVRRCMQHDPVLDRKNGKPVMVKTDDGTLAPAYRFDAQGALKGLELLGKHLKLFSNELTVTGTVKHEHSGTVAHDLPAPSMEEVLALAETQDSKLIELPASEVETIKRNG